MALGPKGEFWVVECKSGAADFRADRKWQGYLDYCDRLLLAVDADFPVNLLPEGTGLILADAFDAEILRMAPEAPLAGARRKAMTQAFARQAALRLQALRDPRRRPCGGLSGQATPPPRRRPPPARRGTARGAAQPLAAPRAPSCQT